MNNEVELLFEMAYLPVAQKRQRLMGQDFLAVAYHLMEELKKQNSNPVFLEDAAKTMVESFNNMLNPKMSRDDMDGMIDYLAHGGIMIDAIAKKAYRELQMLGYV